MELIKLSKKYEAVGESRQDYKTDFLAMRSHLIVAATPGIPYNLISIMQELNKHRKFEMTGEHFIILSLVLKNLIKNHEWRVCAVPGYFCLFNKKHTLKVAEIIDGMVPPKLPFSRGGNRVMFERLTGETLTPSGHGKAIERLVSGGRFEKLEHGKYQRTHVGF